MVGNFASSWGATATVAEGLAQRLVAKGWQVITTSHKKPRVERLSDMLLTTWRRRSEYDVAIVEVFSGQAFAWAEMTCHLLQALGKPHVLSLRGGSLPEFATRWPGRVGRIFSGADAVVAQSEYLAGIVPDRRDRVRLIPNPVDLSECSYRNRAEAQPLLVWLRSFHRIYNPSLAIRVVDLLRGRHPDVLLTMIGPDKGDGSLQATQRLANELGLGPQVRFQGGVPKAEVPTWLNRADIFLNTTNIDNTPVSVEEAMACGLCVVSTDVGGVPYLAADQVNALLVPPDNPPAMAAAVERILTEEGLSSRLSQQARAAVAGMDWPHVVELWEDMVSSVSRHSPQRRR